MTNKFDKLNIEFVRNVPSIDINSMDSKSSLIQLMIQVAQIGLRVDKDVLSNNNKEEI